MSFPSLPAAWKCFRSHWRTFVAGELAIIAAWVVLELAVVSLHSLRLPSPLYWTGWGLLHGGFLWLFCGILAGIHSAAQQVVGGGFPTIATITGGLPMGGRFLCALALYLLAVTMGLSLLVVPGVFIAVRWALFGHVIARERVTVRAALGKSAAISMGHRWALLRLLMLCAALNIAGASLLGLGFLLSFPTTVILTAYFFQGLDTSGVCKSSGDDPMN